MICLSFNINYLYNINSAWLLKHFMSNNITAQISGGGGVAQKNPKEKKCNSQVLFR